MARRRGDPQLSNWPHEIEQLRLRTIRLETAVDTAKFWGKLDAIEDLQAELTRATARLDRSKLATMTGEGLLERPEHRPGQHRAVRPGRRIAST